MVSTLVVVLDLIGTFVFALSGAMLGVHKKLDVFGVLVLSFGASLTGVLSVLILPSTSCCLLPDWEEQLPPETRSGEMRHAETYSPSPSGRGRGEG